MNHLDTDREHGLSSERLKRELPVLFHLMDVSRQRPAAPAVGPLLPSLTLQIPASEPLSPVIERPPVTLPLAESPVEELPPAPTPRPEPVACVVPAIVESVPAAPVAASHSPKFSLDRPIELQVTPSEPVAESPAAADSIEQSIAVDTPAVTEHPVTPRPPFETRRRFRTPFSEDWFAAHGRYIAVVFVIALIGTIYLARTNRRPAVTPIAQTPATGEKPGDGHSHTEPAIVVNTSPLLSSKSASPPKLVETTSAVAEARTELHAPAATEVASQSTTETKSADSLFVFPSAKKVEERVAVRPEAPQAIANPTIASPPPAITPQGPAVGSFSPAMTNFAPPAVPQMPSSPAPLLAPAYPTTAAPPVNYPTTSPPQHAYPTTAAPPFNAAPGSAMPPRVAPGQPANYQPVYPTQPAYPTTGTFPPQPGYAAAPTWQPPAGPMPATPVAAAPGTWTPNSPGGWSPPAPAGGMPPQYQPPNNTASGFRNERTGSSLY